MVFIFIELTRHQKVTILIGNCVFIGVEGVVIIDNMRHAIINTSEVKLQSFKVKTIKLVTLLSHYERLTFMFIQLFRLLNGN